MTLTRDLREDISEEVTFEQEPKEEKEVATGRVGKQYSK